MTKIMTMGDKKSAQWSAYLKANAIVNEYCIRTTPTENSRYTRLEWMRRFIHDCGNPHIGLPTIHVAGSSGKGSVGLLVAQQLRAEGLRVGFHLSPYVQVATEKLWVDGRYATGCEYLRTVESLMPVVEKYRDPDVPLHGLLSVALSLKYFASQTVDLVVFEAGVGGRNDLSNILTADVAIITNIGHDHMKALGPTHREVAAHKVGIIKPDSDAVIGGFKDHADLLFEAAKTECRAVGARSLHQVVDRTTADIKSENQAIATKASQLYLGRIGGQISSNSGQVNPVRSILAYSTMSSYNEPAAAGLPGRLELITDHDRVGDYPLLIDGAHNPDKLAAVLAYLESVFPKRSYILIFGELGSKSCAGSVSSLFQQADRVILTAPEVYQKSARCLDELAEEMNTMAISHYQMCPVPKDALIIARQHSRDLLTRSYDVSRSSSTSTNRRLHGRRSEESSLPLTPLIVVTGSLYLAGNIRDQVFSPTDVLFHQTSWPSGEST